MHPAIPHEQLDRIQPIVDELSAGVRRLFAELPLEAESALAFSPETGAQS
jgi:hypothetical protein